MRCCALRNLHDLITTVHAVQDLEEVLKTTAQGVVDVLGFQVAVINAVDPYGFVEAVAVAGDEDAVRALKSRRMPLAQFIEEFEIADEWGMLRFVPHDRLPEDAREQLGPRPRAAGRARRVAPARRALRPAARARPASSSAC